MTVEEAARILSKMYHASKTRGRGRATTAVHLFGIKYANDLSRFTVDNGPEFAGKAMDEWAYRRGIKLSFIRPGKPVENAFAESFNGRLREECLNTNWFMSVRHAREVIETWRQDYNEVRPHSSLKGRTPKEFADSMAGLS